MCASFEAKFSVTQLVETFAEVGIGLVFKDGLPNLAPEEEVRPTNRTVLVRQSTEDADGLMASFGFSPPVRADGRRAGPVINYRSEGRTFTNKSASGRALIPVSGFFEFTGDSTPKTRWKLHDPDDHILMLAALWRAEEEAVRFSLLTAEPGPDVAPFHTRGVLPLPPARWADWLGGEVRSQELLIPPPSGTLIATPAPRPTPSRAQPKPVPPPAQGELF